MKCESKTQDNNENCKGKKYNVKGGLYLVKASLHVWWKEKSQEWDFRDWRK